MAFQSFTPDYMFELVSRTNNGILVDNTRIIVAIDAPLGFPDVDILAIIFHLSFVVFIVYTIYSIRQLA